jgi:hypothetical protein
MITIYYHSTWIPAYLHTPVKGVWTSLVTSPLREKRYWHFAMFEGCIGQDFVMTDCSGGWDNPSDGGNYKVPSARFALFKGTLVPVQENSDHILVISDLDSTMIGDNETARAATSRFTFVWLSKYFFNGSKLVYSTGRSLQDYLQIHSYGLDFIDPDFLVTSVGGDAYYVNAVRLT